MKILNRLFKVLHLGLPQRYNAEQRQREDRARAMISTVSSGVRARFSDSVLAPLLDAGWLEGRSWEAEPLQHFLAQFNITAPSPAIDVLSEFGGLNIGFRGRTITFGDIEKRLCFSHAALKALLGEPLLPVGRTNIFEDDGLGVLIDASGRMYVNGATGYNIPRDYRLDLISPNIDSFLSRLFSEKHTYPQQSWYYSQPDLV